MNPEHRPDTVTITRKGWDDTGEKEKSAAMVTVASAVSALVAPKSSDVDYTEPGPVDEHKDLIFLAPLTSTTFYTIKTGDILTDDATGEVWIAQKPGRNYRDPTTFAGSALASHTEVEVSKTDWDG